MQVWLRVLAAAASGAVLVFVGPPVNLHWVQWVLYVPLLWAMREHGTGLNVRLALFSGYAAQVTSFSWLVETVVRFSNLHVALGYLALHLFGLAFSVPFLGFAFAHPLRRRLGLAWVFVLPALLVALEFLWPQLFPWYHGVVHYRTSWLWQLVSVTGVWGVSYLVLLSNCVLAEALWRAREGRPPPWGALAAFVVLYVAAVGYGAWRVPRVEAQLARARVLQVSMLQQHWTMEERLETPARVELERWFETTARIAGQGAEFVVWPEGACAYNPNEEHTERALAAMVRAESFDLLLGGGTSERTVDPETGKRRHIHYNSAWFMDRSGEIHGRYDKMVPLPFGEYIPFSKTFPILKEWIQGPGDFRAGTVPTIFQGDGFTFATPICYEAIRHGLMRRFRDADLIVNITNDAWFGDTHCPYQHAMLAAINAVELGRPVLRIAHSGINMIVEPHGRILYETAPFTDEAVVRPLRLGTVDTLYRRLGPWFSWLCIAVSLAGIGIALWRGPSDRPRRSP
ncbi:MAG: apolipoprotein N-acyltransferase [Deltaproteobacteria bacterium]|nr:apolipoprotein N-acyltransferase [Deltaproteobacteria bacterium]